MALFVASLVAKVGLFSKREWRRGVLSVAAQDGAFVFWAYAVHHAVAAEGHICITEKTSVHTFFFLCAERFFFSFMDDTLY